MQSKSIEYNACGCRGTSRVKLDRSFVGRNVNSLMEIIDGPERVQLLEWNALWLSANEPVEWCSF